MAGDIYYIHDITSTSVKNQTISNYISNNKIDGKDIPKDIFDHIHEKPDKSTDVVFLQCYQYEGNGRITHDQKYLLSVIGEKYTHYVEDAQGEFEFSRPVSKEFDFRNHCFKKRCFRQEAYYCERESSTRVFDLYSEGERVYGNSHKFLNEFCYNLYEPFLDTLDFKGRLVDLSSLRSRTSCFDKRLFSNPKFIESELVFFGSAKDIAIIDDSSVLDFVYAHKTLSFDIETVTIDDKSKKISDTIIQISATYQEHDTLKRCIGITIGDVITDPKFYTFPDLSKYFSNGQMPPSEVFRVQTEKELIQTFIQLVQEVKPDFLCGYNIVGYDLPILFQAADRYNIDLFDALSSITHWTYDKKAIKVTLGEIKKMKGTTSAMDNNRNFQLGLNLFPGLLLNDLFRCHKGENLDELTKQELGFGKEDVAHSEIARYFYDSKGSRSQLLRYNFKDSLLCAALLNTSDHFQSYKFFIAASYNTKIPPSEFFDLKKTPLLSPLFYYAYEKRGMLQEMKIKPQSKCNEVVIKELLMYFLFEDRTVRHPKTIELIEKFESGNVKTITVNKQFDFQKHAGTRVRLDMLEAIAILREQFDAAKSKNKKKGSQFYTLTHLLLYIRYLNDPVEHAFNLNDLIDDYRMKQRYEPVLLSNKSTAAIEKARKNREIELTHHYKHLLSYLSRRAISSTHTIQNLCDDFANKEMSNKKYASDVKKFAVYLNSGVDGLLQDNFKQTLNSLWEEVETKRFTDRQAPQTFCDECFKIFGSNVLLKFDDSKSSYDGAFVYLPNPGVELDKPVTCLDFSSMYPSIGICYNVGPETVLSKSTIVQYGLQAGIDYHTVNIFSRDDYKGVDVKNISGDEARRNFVSFMTPRHTKSVMCSVWKDLLEKRLHYKRQIGTFDNPGDNKRVKEISDTYKIIANSIYGLFPNMGHWKISAAVTSVGRQHIQSVATDIQKSHNSSTVYGDTDSVMLHFNYTTYELCHLYQSGDLHRRGWLDDQDNEEIDKFKADHYKQGCIITAAISKHIAHKLNRRYMDEPDQAIYRPPSKLEHEKVMLPFAIFQQKHYFARIMDTDVEKESIITKGLESTKRTVLKATYEVEQTMFKDLLQRNPCTWDTYKSCYNVISELLSGTIDLYKISFRKKVTVAGYKLESSHNDPGVLLFKRMKDRGEMVETGGLDKISLRVVKVENPEKKSNVKYETIEYLRKKQLCGEDLELNKKDIAKQILNEVIKIMKVIHPAKTFAHFQDLINLKLPDQVMQDAELFSVFKRPEDAVKSKALNLMKQQSYNNSI